jgi:glycosyltransferase involved in cell wall biosynthesis
MSDPRRLRISVCLCTLDGERHLQELLDSIARQSLLPDELLVGDDGSSDRTLAIVRNFAEEAPFAVRVARRAQRLGPAGNLEALLRGASGDLLFPADQDDIWHRDKIAAVSTALSRCPTQMAAVHDSILVDDGGSEIGTTLFELTGLDAEVRRRLASGSGLADLARQNVVASHALALRRPALDLVLPFPECRHGDWWVALLCATVGGILVLDEPLVCYRQHEGNIVGTRRTILERSYGDASAVFADRAHMLEAVLERLDERAQGSVTVTDRATIHSQIAHLRTRSRLPSARWRRVAPVAREVLRGGYSRFAHGLRTAAADLARRGAD